MKGKVTLNKDNCKILICCHKPCELPPNPDGLFLPIQVGAAISDVDLGMQRDDQVNGEPCDNISAKNKSYCELTALYWAWKNIKKIYPNLEYIGLNHYRRYFSFDKKNCFDDAVVLPENEVKKYELDKSKLEKILSKYDALMAKPRVYPYSLEVDYSVCHVSDDIKTIGKLIHDNYSDYYSDFLSVITCNNKLSHYNMTVIGWNDFCKYCEWIFSVLNKAENIINIANYNATQSRIWGYLAERLFNVWIVHNNQNIKFLNIIKFFNGTVHKKIWQVKKRIKVSLAYNINYKSIGINFFLNHKNI
ncbi:DUF4422 domain-containing protein [uncultured Treponema sp.]|uniref:DUF4422 domain-containing protein n=1 Tax=uncultured Treponema sp. TaxID=162155 RepID=UPI0025DE0406|nr:DUF4422 domain-containing protein [uncultured Treponema sp.]